MIRLMCLLSLAGSSVSAEVLEFRKVDYFVVVTEDGEEPKEQKFDARLEIEPGRKTTEDCSRERRGRKGNLRGNPVRGRNERSVRAVQVAACQDSHLPVASGTICAGKKHWLTIEYKGGYSYMRLDKKNQRQVRAALGAAGFEVEVMVE